MRTEAARPRRPALLSADDMAQSSALMMTSTQMPSALAFSTAMPKVSRSPV